MTEIVDAPDIDDFRDSGFDWERDVDGRPSSGWNSRFALHDINREEDRADRRYSEARQRADKDRPAVPREEWVRQILLQRVRTKYTDRNRQYSLRDSEINTLGEVGKFRVVAVNDLAESHLDLSLGATLDMTRLGLLLAPMRACRFAYLFRTRERRLGIE